MDKCVRKQLAEAIVGGPAIVFANWFQFGAGETLVRPRVESRMLLWCVSGKGRVQVNGEEHVFFPGQWLLMPWLHEVVYRADEESPFFVGGIHLLPWHADDAPMVFQVAHTKNDPLANHSGRLDRVWEDMDGTVTGRFASERDRLAILAAYIVERFQHSSPPTRALAKTLAGLVLEELKAALATAAPATTPKPAPLHRMQEYVRTRLDQILTVKDLATIANCSVATVHRLFRTFESASPARWMASLRAEQAALLLRTTRLDVQDVARQVGMHDPFHFSRFFKREKGLSPRAYQQTRRFI